MGSEGIVMAIDLLQVSKKALELRLARLDFTIAELGAVNSMHDCAKQLRDGPASIVDDGPTDGARQRSRSRGLPTVIGRVKRGLRDNEDLGRGRIPALGRVKRELRDNNTPKRSQQHAETKPNRIRRETTTTETRTRERSQQHAEEQKRNEEDKRNMLAT